MRAFEMIRILRLKYKARGLVTIAAIGLLQSLLPLYGVFEHPSILIHALEDWQIAWAILRLPCLFFLLWLACFSLVQAVQHKKLHLAFFENFNTWKGLAVLLVWPALLFWKQVLTDYHQALDFLHPFTSLVTMHLVMAFLFIVFVAPLSLFLVARSKAKKPDIKALQNMKQNALPNLLWGKLFFEEAGSTWPGNAIFYFTGISYLIFFYMTIFSLASPAALATKTLGSTVEAHDVNYIWASRYGTHTGGYCVLDINSNREVLQFALKTCPPCSRQPNASVIVTHHPTDYRNLGISSVECEYSFPTGN
jgi:hypothetical protein